MAKPKSRLRAAYPAWAEELRRRYLRGEASQFVLHGNVFDLVEYDGELLPVQRVPDRTLLSENKDVVVVYNVSTGGRLLRRKADLGGFDELLLQRERDQVPARAWSACCKTAQKVALIIEYAETVAPAADPALMSDDDRSVGGDAAPLVDGARDRGVGQRRVAAGREPDRAAPEAGRRTRRSRPCACRCPTRRRACA